MTTNKLLLLLLLTVLSNRSFTQGIAFAPKVDSITDGVNPTSVAIADIDGDGKLDVVVANTNDNTVSVFLNTSTVGTISFADRVDFATGSEPSCVGVADIDGDGRLDVVVTNSNGGTVSVLLNTSTIGAVSFAAQVTLATTGIEPSALCVGDIDGDGKPDLAVVAYKGYSILSVFRNLSTPGLVSFTTQVTYPAASDPFSVSIGDIDGDGRPDLAVANWGNTVSVFRSTSSIDTISFAARVDFATETQPRSVCIGDIDGDGKLDLAVACQGSNTISVLRNTSVPDTISFEAQVAFTTGPVASAVTPVSVVIGDINGDRKPDLEVANSNSNTVGVLLNTSTVGTINAFSFAAGLTFTTGAEPASVAIGDIDGDGKPDLTLANSGTNTISVLRQTSPSLINTISSALDFSVYPNPFTNQVEIKVINPTEGMQVAVFDILGRKLYSQKWGYAQSINLSLGTFSSGMYLLTLTNDGKTFTKRLIKN